MKWDGTYMPLGTHHCKLKTSNYMPRAVSCNLPTSSFCIQYHSAEPIVRILIPAKYGGPSLIIGLTRPFCLHKRWLLKWKISSMTEWLIDWSINLWTTDWLSRAYGPTKTWMRARCSFVATPDKQSIYGTSWLTNADTNNFAWPGHKTFWPWNHIQSNWQVISMITFLVIMHRKRSVTLEV